jgi:hypothetical protein
VLGNVCDVEVSTGGAFYPIAMETVENIAYIVAV